MAKRAKSRTGASNADAELVMEVAPCDVGSISRPGNLFLGKRISQGDVFQADEEFRITPGVRPGLIAERVKGTETKPRQPHCA